MNIDEYNKICRVYQSLTKRFDNYQNYFFNGNYIVFDSEFYVVRENLDILRKFENLTIRHIYGADYIKSKPFGDSYLDSKLVVIEENKVMVNSEMGYILFYILIYKLAKGLEDFKKIISTLDTKYSGHISIEKETKTYKMSIGTYDKILAEFEKSEDLKLIVHLFSRTNSNFIVQNWNSQIEINMAKIEALSDTVKIFDFSNIQL